MLFLGLGALGFVLSAQAAQNKGVRLPLEATETTSAFSDRSE